AIEDGVAPHDPVAVGVFGRFVDRITRKDLKWSKCKTWLVDTGDLTSLGDQNSLKLGQRYLAELTKICPEAAAIYGNHDAWPGKLPLWVKSKTLSAQAKTLKGFGYGIGAPTLALEIDIPHGGGKVQLF